VLKAQSLITRVMPELEYGEICAPGLNLARGTKVLVMRIPCLMGGSVQLADGEGGGDARIPP
jgi:hypothetical protein